ncbi:MAG TPA: hypothetical protein VFG10_03415 [Saprospiraceae bacterium]|nr:hypothetical protein [Saprospiraceae bacterium]
MSQTNNSTTQSIHLPTLLLRMLIGGVIAFLVISFFVFGAYEPNPAWGNLWRIKPLLLTPAAGAMGGAFYYFMEHMSHRGLNKAVAIILSVIGYVIVLWLGVVLGLNGTMWD